MFSPCSPLAPCCHFGFFVTMIRKTNAWALRLEKSLEGWIGMIWYQKPHVNGFQIYIDWNFPPKPFKYPWHGEYNQVWSIGDMHPLGTVASPFELGFFLCVFFVKVGLAVPRNLRHIVYSCLKDWWCILHRCSLMICAWKEIYGEVHALSASPQTKPWSFGAIVLPKHHIAEETEDPNLRQPRQLFYPKSNHSKTKAACICWSLLSHRLQLLKAHCL